jgi:hypothetical protein
MEMRGEECGKFPKRKSHPIHPLDQAVAGDRLGVAKEETLVVVGLDECL